MKWSISKSRIFSQCQRKWYYLDIMASWRKTDPIRREVYLLRQLQSIYAWRGSLVDKVIEKLIIPRVRYGNLPTEEEVIDYSMQLMEKQLTFGKAQKHQCPDITKKKAGDEYCAFYDVEYNGGLNENQLEEVKKDIKTALINVMRSDIIKEFMADRPYLITQRPLQYKFAETGIVSIPDLIAFYKDKPPTIIDWKVHSFGNTEYWLQLGVYGFVLSRVKPHKDFPDSKNQLHDPTNFRLIEYQLLKNKQRKYSLSEQDLIDIEDYIFLSMTQMKRLLDGKKYGEIDISKFQTAYSPKMCVKCQFKKMCWAGG